MTKFWKPLIIFLVISPVLLFLGFISTGYGHGNYIWARILFPYAGIIMILGSINNFWLTSIYEKFVVTISLLQFPLYGAILGIANLKGRLFITLVGLAVVHLFLVVLCFIIPSGSF